MTTDVGSFEASQADEGGPTPVSSRVSPTDRLRAEIDALFTGERDLVEVLEDVARLGARLLIQADRIVERALLVELDQVIDPLLPWSFAYRRGLGVRDAVTSLIQARDEGAAWVARADIDECFDRIPRWEVLRRLRELLTDPQAVDLLRRLLHRPVVGARQPGQDRGLGLHQGSVLTPPTQ
jgi:hypothetical protein